MKTTIQMQFSGSDMAELKFLNKRLASQAVTLDSGDHTGKFHMFYAGFCMALSHLGLDGCIDVEEDTMLNSILNLSKDSNMCDLQLSEIMKILGYRLTYRNGVVIGFEPLKEPTP